MSDAPDYIDEAKAWLRGQRSHTNNIFAVTPWDGRAEAIVLTHQADAATCEQSYWILRAAGELPLEPTDDPAF